MKRIAILGSTGSIGRSTLSVVESYPDRFRVSTLAAGNNAELAFEQAVRWKPRVVSLADEAAAQALQDKLRQAGHGENEVEVVNGGAGSVAGRRGRRPSAPGQAAASRPRRDRGRSRVWRPGDSSGGDPSRSRFRGQRHRRRLRPGGNLRSSARGENRGPGEQGMPGSGGGAGHPLGAGEGQAGAARPERNKNTPPMAA